MIRRSPRKGGFTVLDNSVFAEGNSFRAMGLLGYLLSKPDHWQVSVTQLVKFSANSSRRDGRDSIYRILDELIERGYIARVAQRDPGGKLKGYVYEVYDTPQPRDADAPAPKKTAPKKAPAKKPASKAKTAPAVASRVVEQHSPFTALPYTAEPTQVNTERTVNTEDQKHTTGEPVTPVGVDPFELAWAAYPKRQGGNPKNKAREKWSARLKEGITAEVLLAGVARYAAYCQATGSVGTCYVMQAVRFFGTDGSYAEDWTASKSTPPRKPGGSGRHVGLVADHDEPAVATGGF
jgi:hypothetical protein